MQTCTPEWRTSFLREVTPDSSTFKNVSVDIGVVNWYWCDRGAGQSYGNTKNCNIDNKNKTKKTYYQITFEKKKFHINSTEMYMAFARLLK